MNSDRPKPLYAAATYGITLRYSLLANCHIPYSDIASVSTSRGPLGKGAIKLSPLEEMEPHNVELTLAKPTTVYGYLGSQKSGTSLVFNVCQASAADLHWHVAKIGSSDATR